MLSLVYQCTLTPIQYCISVRKPLANCQQEREVSTLSSRTQISSIQPQSETLISDATFTLLCPRATVSYQLNVGSTDGNLSTHNVLQLVV